MWGDSAVPPNFRALEVEHSRSLARRPSFAGREATEVKATMLHFKPSLDLDAVELAKVSPRESAAGRRVFSVQHFCYRARQERQAALRASDPERRRAHLKAADLHRQLARSLSRHHKRHSPREIVSHGEVSALPDRTSLPGERAAPRLRLLVIVVIGASALIALFGGLSLLVQFLKA